MTDNDNVKIQKHEQAVEAVQYEGDSARIVRQVLTTIHYEADILTTDAPTASGRVYPREVMERALLDYQKRVANHTAFGELGPTYESGPRQSLDNVSHVITKAELQGNVVHVTTTSVQTPAGNRLAGLIEAGAVELQLAGMGSVTDGRVNDDYTILSIDFVTVPPAKPAT